MSRQTLTAPLRERIGPTLMVAYASTGVGQLANQLFFFLLLRYLTVDQVGLYGFAVALATIYSYVTDFGLSTFLVGELSRTSYRLRTLVELMAVARAPVVILGLAGLVGWAWFSHPAAQDFWTVGLVGLAFVIQLFDVGLTPWFQTRERQNVVNVVALVVPLCRLVGVGVPLLLGWGLPLPLVVSIFLATQLVGSACLLVLGVLEDRRTERTSSEGGVRQLLSRFWSRGPRLAVMYAMNVLQTRIDWLLVSVMISRAALANYSLANKVIESVMLIAAVWARTSFPWQSRADAREPHLATRLSLLRRLFVVSSGLLTVILFYWSSPLIHLAFGNKYAAADPALSFMALATAVFMLNQYLFYLVLTERLEGPYTYLIVAATAVQVMADVVLIPRLGILGAAVGLVVMSIVLHAGQLILLNTRRVLALDEIARADGFLVCVVAGLLACRSLGLGETTGTFMLLLVVGGVGGFVVLDAKDRDRVLGWMTHVGPSRPGV